MKQTKKQISIYFDKTLKLRLVVAVALLLLLAACKKSEVKEPSLTQEIISQIKGTSEGFGNETGEQEQEQGQQIVIPPQQQQQFQSGNVLSPDYKSPCMLEKYRFINVYCKGKTFWSQQATILSWHIPYSIVSFFAFILILAIIGYFVYKLMHK